MTAFRALLTVFITTILIYTAIVIMNHGWNPLPVFLGDTATMTWTGQFNVDLFSFLLLSGLWIAWRHGFTPGGIALGLLGTFGGIMVLAPYLFAESFRSNGDMTVLLLGKNGTDG